MKRQFIFIGLLAFITRFIGIAQESLWRDEFWTLEFALGTASQDWHFPLFYTLEKFAISWFGINEFSLRFFPMVFGVAACLAFFMVARQLFTKNQAFNIAILFTLSNIFIYYSKEARMYSLYTFLFLAMVFFMIRFIRTQKTHFLIFYGIFSFLMLYTHLLGVLPFILSQLVMFLFFKPDKRWKGMLIGISLVYSITLVRLIDAFIQLYRIYIGPRLLKLVPLSDLGLLLVFILTFLISVGVIVLAFYKRKSLKQMVKKFDKWVPETFILAVLIGIVVIYIVYIDLFLFSFFAIRYLIFLLPLAYLYLGHKMRSMNWKRQVFNGLVILELGIFFFAFVTVNSPDIRGAVEFARPYVDDSTLIISEKEQFPNLFAYYFKAGDEVLYEERHDIDNQLRWVEDCEGFMPIAARYDKVIILVPANSFDIGAKPHECISKNWTLFDYKELKFLDIFIYGSPGYR